VRRSLSLKNVDLRCWPLECCPGAYGPVGRRGEPSFRRDAAANVPGQTTSSHNSRGSVSQGDPARPELVAIHELEPDALAQTGEQRRPVSGKDRLHKELVLVDQSQICQR
jgi:hypothetical protein